MKRILISGVFVAILMGCGQKQSDESELKQKTIHVSTVKVKQLNVETPLRYSGTIEAIQTIPVGFRTMGTVERVFVDVGDEVRKGQLLAILNESEAISMHEIALAKYKQAEDAYNRLKNVYENGSLSEIKWVEMETNLAQAKYSLALAKENLDKCKLYAPENSVVGSRNIEPGMSSVSLASSPFELIDIRQVYVKVSVPENEVSKFEVGMNAHFVVSALNERGFEGEVTTVSPVADKISRTYEAKIKVNNPEKVLKPGMVCDVTMDKTGGKEMLLIPSQCVSVDYDNNSYVYVVDMDSRKVKKQIVKIGQFQGSELEVLDGLSAGQLIVREGKEKLSDNSLISL